jgi:ubiquinone/menaquinone biosynthesis C-methylase UbiE
VATLFSARSHSTVAALTLGKPSGKLPFSDHGFDVVTGLNSLQYAGNPIVALGEARRVTRPRGAVVIVTWGTPHGMEAAALVAAAPHWWPCAASTGQRVRGWRLSP